VDTDVVVVGSGHNGLVCAAYLAKWGYRVTVVERRATIGGAVCTEEMFGGYRMDVGGSLHFMVHHTPIVADLELSRYGLEYIKLDPFMSGIFPDGNSVSFHEDLDATCESIARLSQKDAETYRQFVRDWKPMNEAVFEFFLKAPTMANLGRTFFFRKLHETREKRNEMVRRVLGSYGRFIDDLFESPQLRAALAWWGAQSGPPPVDAVSTEFIGWHSVVHNHGPARPRGGSGMLTRALADYITDHGGTVVSGTPVEEILVSGGRAVGVRTADGETVTARRVVSNAHVWVTFLQLLSKWTPPDLRRRVEQIRVGNGFGMVIRCAMDRLPEYRLNHLSGEDAVRGLQLLCPSTSYLQDAYADYLRGLPASRPAAIGMTFSSVDPSLAPPGKHVLFVWGQYYPYRLREGTWEDIENAEAHKLLSVVEEYAPGTRSALRDMYIQSPPRIEEKHNMPHGNVMHVEMTVDQMFMHRPLPELSRYQTPLPGLFLASAGMHPGGGIFGAPGYNCAHVLKKSLRGRR